MSRKISLRLGNGDPSAAPMLSVEAELREADAPLACEMLWGLLATPFIGEAVHAIYAGPAVLVSIPSRHGEPRGGQIPVENETDRPEPGDLLLLPPDPEAEGEAPAEGVTLALFYGESGRPLTPQGWVPGVRVASVRGDLQPLRGACQRVRFEGAQQVRLSRVDGESKPEVAVLHADGSSLGNPGPAGAGFVLTDTCGQVLAEGSIPLQPDTVNVAEYRALIAGLAEAARRGVRTLQIRMDSELVIKQLNGQYRVKAPGLRPLHQWARKLMGRFEAVRCEHVPRGENARADELAAAASRRSKERLQRDAE
ncbi:MAG TPA: DUF3830 family protein [Armatimonadota bacterium]|nr:DUF3830 family protein [Armatimonadota bacterium]